MEEKEKNNEETEVGRRAFLKYLLYSLGASLGAMALFGGGTYTGYRIWGTRKIPQNEIPEKPLEVKTLDELVGNFYYPEKVEVTIGENPYGVRKNILHVKARSRDESIGFTVFETDRFKFDQMAAYFKYIKDYDGAFGIDDPLEMNTGYPRDYRAGIQFSVERSAEDLPVYKFAGDDILFYPIFKKQVEEYLGF